MQPQGLDLIDIIHKGAIATYPLILLSIVSVAVVFERLWSLRNIGAITLRVTESILEPIKKGQRDLQAKLALAGGPHISEHLGTRCGRPPGSRQQHRRRSDV